MYEDCGGCVKWLGRAHDDGSRDIEEESFLRTDYPRGFLVDVWSGVERAVPFREVVVWRLVDDVCGDLFPKGGEAEGHVVRHPPTSPPDPWIHVVFDVVERYFARGTLGGKGRAGLVSATDDESCGDDELNSGIGGGLDSLDNVAVELADDSAESVTTVFDVAECGRRVKRRGLRSIEDAGDLDCVEVTDGCMVDDNGCNLDCASIEGIDAVTVGDGYPDNLGFIPSHSSSSSSFVCDVCGAWASSWRPSSQSICLCTPGALREPHVALRLSTV